MRRSTPLLALACLSPLASAQVHQDMLLMIDPEGRLVTGLVDFDTQTPLAASQRVFDATFDIFSGGGLEFATTDVPGFNALLPSNPAISEGFSTLAPNTEVSFDARTFRIDGVGANLWHWDGTGAVEFAPATVVTNISRAPNVIFSVDLDGSDTDVAGFTIDFANSSGALHRHVDFEIVDAGSAPRGFYLWSFDLTAGSLQAEPVYFVHALGSFDQQAYDDAIAFVNEEFVAEEALCPADFDGDDDVDFGDFGFFVSAFDSVSGDANYEERADFDGDGDVDFGDFGAFVTQFDRGPAECAG